MKKYIIWAPEYSKSNGVKTLYRLYKEIEKRGYEVYLYCKEKKFDEFNYIEIITNDIKNNFIIIYPEIVVGNPLRIRNVVRYILYYPGKLKGDKKFHQSEVLFTHCQKYSPEAHILTIPWINENIFYDDNSVKIQDCYFVYKGGKFRNVKETNGLLELNMDYPKTQEELADILRKTSTLYSYDSTTSVLDEAKICGAKVKIITQEGMEDYTYDYYKEIDKFEIQMNEFINITQKMNYQGEIEKIRYLDKIKKLKYKIKKMLKKRRKFNIK
jgi:hypothetical protein